MPAASGGDLTKLRGAHSSKMWLAVLVPEDIITARVNGDHTRGDTTIACSSIVGTQADVKSEMLVWFGSASGTYDLGRYMAKSMAAGVLTIEENDLDLDGNEYVTVKRLWTPRSKLPEIDVSGADVVFTKWGVAYSDQNTNTPVVNCMGPPDCQFIDAGLGYAEVRFVDEYSWSPVGASKSVVTWDYDGGSYQSGAGTAASPNLVRYSSAGSYWVSLTITDSNGKVTVTWRPVFIFDSNNLPYEDWNTPGRELSQDGNRQNLSVTGDADEANFPPGTWVVRFNQDYYDGVEGVIENTYPFRGHIKFVGFIREGSVQTDTEVSQVEFEVIDITTYLDELPAFGDVIKDTDSPSEWTEMSNPTVIRAVVHVLMWQSNILTIADLLFDLERTDPSELYIAAQRWGKGSLLEQVNLPLLHKGIYAQCSGNKQGCLNVRQDPSLVDITARAAYVTTVCHLTNADYSTLSFTTKRNTIVQYVRFTGIAYDGSSGVPYGSKAPGVPDQATSVEDIGGQVLVSQVDTNRLAGDLKAKLENDIVGAQLYLPGNWDIFDPSLQERISFDLALSENNLGLAYDNTDFWIVRGVDIQENPHTGVVTGVSLSLEKETEGVPGVTLPIGTEPTWPPPDPPPPEPDLGGDEIPLYDGIIIGTDGDGIFYCDDGELNGTPVWANLKSNQLIGVGGKSVYELTLSATSVEYLYACTACAIYRIQIPFTVYDWTKTATELVDAEIAVGLTLSDITWWSLRMDPSNPGYGYAVATYTAGGASSYVGLFHTRDYWDSIYRAITVGTGTHYHNYPADLSIIPGSSGADVLVAGRYWGGAMIWKVTGYAAGITALEGPTGDDEVLCWAHRSNANRFVWCMNPNLRYTNTGAAPFTSMACQRVGWGGLMSAPDDDDKITIFGNQECYDWDWGDGSVTQFLVTWAYPGGSGTDGQAYDGVVIARDVANLPTSVIRVGHDNGSVPSVRLATASSSTDKASNLAALGVTNSIRSIAKRYDGSWL